MIRKQFLFPLLKEICLEEHITFIEEYSRGMYAALLFDDGRRFFIKDVNFNINYVGSMRVTKNKVLTTFFLNKFGYKTPVYAMVYSDEKCEKFHFPENLENGLKFANDIGYPIIVKLNDSSQGRGIYKAYNDEEFKSVAETLFTTSSMFQVQKCYDYHDYRVVVLGEKVICAYERIPLYVVGDGISTIEELLHKKQKKYFHAGRDTIIDIYGEVTKTCLNRQNYTLKTILDDGVKVILRDVSNLSAGGECVDLTDKIHDDFLKLSISIAKDLNLDLCGIDIMCPDICKPIDDYVILEVNSAPGLDNYVYTEKKQQRYVKELYRQVILFLRDSYR